MTTLDIVIPGLNEEKILANTVDTLSEFMTSHMADYDWRIVIADNGSTDATQEIGRRSPVNRAQCSTSGLSSGEEAAPSSTHGHRATPT